MKFEIRVNEKIYKVSFWKYLAMQNQRELEKIKKLLEQRCNECPYHNTQKLNGGKK